MRIPYIPSAYEKRLSMLDRKRFLLRSVRLAIRQAKEKEKKQRKSTETKPGRTDGQKQNEKTPKIFNGGEIGKKSPKTTFQRGKNEKKGRF